MKIGQVTELDKQNNAKKMPVDFDVSVIFPIYYQFGAIWKPDSGCIVYKTYIFIKGIFLSEKK